MFRRRWAKRGDVQATRKPRSHVSKPGGFCKLRHEKLSARTRQRKLTSGWAQGIAARRANLGVAGSSVNMRQIARINLDIISQIRNNPATVRGHVPQDGITQAHGAQVHHFICHEKMHLQVTCFHLNSERVQDTRHTFLHDAPRDHVTAALRLILTEGIRVLGQRSGNPCHLLQNVNEPSIVYYITHWRNLQAYAEFCITRDCKLLLDNLRLCKAILEWDETYSVAHPKSIFENAYGYLLHKMKSTYEAEIIAITRFSIGRDDEDDCRSHLKQLQTRVESISKFKAVVGNKILYHGNSKTHPKQYGAVTSGGPHLFVSGWNTVKDYLHFATGGGFWGDPAMTDNGSIFEQSLASPIRLH